MLCLILNVMRALSFLVNHVEERTWWTIQSPNKEKSERLRGEVDQIKFINLRFKRRQVVGFRKGRRQDIPYTAVSSDANMTSRLLGWLA